VKTAFYKSFDRDLKDLKKNRQVLGRVQDAIEEVEEADDLRELPSLKKLSGSNRASVQFQSASLNRTSRWPAMATKANVKQEAKRLMDELPDDATWDDAMYKLYVRQSIEQGLADSRAGRTVDVKEVRRAFGLDK
jgi:hypothetical protein